MKKLPDEVLEFFHKQHFVIVSTIARDGAPHSSCKGITEIKRNGTVHLLDLYRGKTFVYLRENPRMSITAVDEHTFTGYCLRGRAKIVDKKYIKPGTLKAWENKVAGRITYRLLKNIKDAGAKGHRHHPESLFPMPEYMIAMEVNEVVNLSPHHINIKKPYGKGGS